MTFIKKYEKINKYLVNCWKKKSELLPLKILKAGKKNPLSSLRGFLEPIFLDLRNLYVDTQVGFSSIYELTFHSSKLFSWANRSKQL